MLNKCINAPGYALHFNICKHAVHFSKVDGKIRNLLYYSVANCFIKYQFKEKFVVHCVSFPSNYLKYMKK